MPPRAFAPLCLLLIVLLPTRLLAGELRVALFDVAPYSYRNAQGQVQGIYVEQVMQLARLIHREPRIELTSFARRDWLIAQGQADLAIGFETDTLKHSALRLGPVAWVDSIILLRPGLSTGDLQELKLGRIRGGCSDLQARNPAQAFHEINHYQSGLHMLLNQRLDGLCGTRDALEYSARQEAIDLADLHQLPLTQGREVWVFVSHKASAELHSLLTWAVEKMTAASPGSGH